MAPPVPHGSRILLTGASGQVGHELLIRLSRLGQVTAPPRSRLDLASAESIRAAVRSLQPTVIINAAAYTAVDRAESDSQVAMAVNATAPGVLAEEAGRCRALLVHYSTDYVFDGAKRTPYREEDQTGPLNEYGRTKLLGEQRVATEGGAYWIVRSGWIYGWRGRNFLLNMLRLGSEREELRIVDDQVGTPTSAAAIAEATLQLLEHHQQAADQAYEQACGMAGIYHAACSGETSWFRFARAIFDHARKPGGWAELKVRRVIPITTAEYPTPARRPGYSVLCKDKITRAFGLQFPGWEDDLATVMKRLAQSALEETVS